MCNKSSIDQSLDTKREWKTKRTRAILAKNIGKNRGKNIEKTIEKLDKPRTNRAATITSTTIHCIIGNI